MIEKFLKDFGQENVKDMLWGMNYRTVNDNYAIVYDDGGRANNHNNETSLIRLNYQVEIGSRNWDKARAKAYEIYHLFNQLFNVDVQTSYKDGNTTYTEEYYLQSLLAETPPIRVGVIDDTMIYTINLNAQIYTVCEQ